MNQSPDMGRSDREASSYRHRRQSDSTRLRFGSKTPFRHTSCDYEALPVTYLFLLAYHIPHHYDSRSDSGRDVFLAGRELARIGPRCSHQRVEPGSSKPRVPESLFVEDARDMRLQNARRVIDAKACPQLLARGSACE